MPTERQVSLEVLLADPAGAIEVSTEQAIALLARLSRVQAVLLNRAMTEEVNIGEEPGPPSPASSPSIVTPARSPDELLTVDQAAAVLNVSPRWLYRHAKTLPFAHKLSRKVLRFSRSGITRWLASRRT